MVIHRDDFALGYKLLCPSFQSVAERVVTMLWGPSPFQLLRPAMQFVQILKVFFPIPPVQQKGLAALSAVCFYHRDPRAHFYWIDGQASHHHALGHLAFQFTRPQMRLCRFCKCFA